MKLKHIFQVLDSMYALMSMEASRCSSHLHEKGYVTKDEFIAYLRKDEVG